MKHKTYVKEIYKAKALYNHNLNHKENINLDCDFCKLFPKATIIVKDKGIS